MLHFHWPRLSAISNNMPSVQFQWRPFLPVSTGKYSWSTHETFYTLPRSAATAEGRRLSWPENTAVLQPAHGCLLHPRRHTGRTQVWSVALVTPGIVYVHNVHHFSENLLTTVMPPANYTLLIILYLATQTCSRVFFIGSRPSDHYFRSVCLSVCLCRVFLSRLWSDFDQTRTYVICLGLVVSPRI